MTNQIDIAERNFFDSFAALERAVKLLPYRPPGWNDEKNEVELDEEPLSEKEVYAIEDVQNLVVEMRDRAHELKVARDMAELNTTTRGFRSSSFDDLVKDVTIFGCG